MVHLQNNENHLKNVCFQDKTKLVNASAGIHISCLRSIKKLIKLAS
jgi:hypothetical protein